MTLIRSSAGPNPLRGFQVDPASIGRIGRELRRPECILAGAGRHAVGRRRARRCDADRLRRLAGDDLPDARPSFRSVEIARRAACSKERCPTDWPLRATATS